VAVVCVENAPARVAALAAWLGLELDACLQLQPLSEDASGSGEPELGDERLCAPAWAAAPPPAGRRGGSSSSSSGGAPPPFPPAPLPRAVTTRALLARYLDIAAVPSRAALRQLSLYARSSEQAGKLRELASAAGGELYSEYCVGEARGWWEVLLEFGSLRPLPLPVLLELVPRLAPRHYSSASACSSSSSGGAPPALELCVARLVYRTRAHAREVRGCGSQYLCSLPLGARVGVRLVRGNLRHPLPAGAGGAGAPPPPPVLMIGPGTGIAPMRALVAALGSSCPPALAASRLYFGCRHAARDDLYGAEFRGAAAAGALGAYRCAYSRDGSGGARVYVQALLEEDGEAVRRALGAGGRVLLAGSASSGLVRGVREALVRVLGGEDGGGREALAALERARRVVVEAW
jgi:sulfite reductase alpha subunit-like flavoprotein